MAERQPSKLHVASSNLVSRSIDPAAGGPDALRLAALRLRTALDRVIRPTPGLADDVEALSAAYRAGTPPMRARGFVHDERTAAAYAAARMPATFAALGRALLEGALAMPGGPPRSLLDVGAGTGAASWAAGAIWPGLETVTLIDREPAMLLLGRRLAAAGEGEGPLARADWRLGTAGIAGPDLPVADLVVAGYVLGEVDDPSRARLVETAWAAARGALVLVEPGSPAGFARILAARESLMAAGAAIVAPCPGNVPCPVRGPAWCHFLTRLDRSPLQRRAKGADRSWEDEPFSYVVASRAAGRPAPRVVLGRPRHRPGRVELRVCTLDGLAEPTISRRHGPAWHVARDLEWGDRVGPTVADHLAADPPADPPALIVEH